MIDKTKEVDIIKIIITMMIIIIIIISMIFITKIGTTKIIILKIKDFGKVVNKDAFVVKRKEIFIKIVKYGKKSWKTKPRI
jgi:hypothetical protein